ncbi:acyl-CoA dehydrogenase family protein [Micromonospora sp. NPDC050980]|uniref:acyl-CoA dehydrogenase family protein n=1 Tax=Micromonospora sp. NPDC050980 TaxID=3155161 RepID=UPI0034053743
MDFALTGEQEALRDTAAKYLADERACADDDRAWADVAGLGWLDPELGTVELALLAEQLGHARSPLPWWAAVGLAGPALHAGGRTVRRPATLAWAEEGSGPGTLAGLLAADRAGGCVVAADGTLTGRKVAVPHAAQAVDLVVAVAGPDGVELRLVDGSARCARCPVPPDRAGLDPTRPAATVELSAVASTPLVPAPAGAGVLAQIRRRTLTLLAAEAVGVASRALAWATGYATTRTQFGRPIGANQAVAHPLAELYGRIETARSLAYRAAWSVDAEPGPAADRAVAAAAVAGREAATTACETAIQTYGGSGFTWEQPLHHWYRRAWWLATFDGTVSDLRAELAASLLDEATGQDAPGR